MNKVLVWKSYGETEVFQFSNGMADKVKDKVLQCVNGLYDNYSIVCLEDQTTMSGIVEWVQEHTDDDENFDQFEIVELQEL